MIRRKIEPHVAPGSSLATAARATIRSVGSLTSSAAVRPGRAIALSQTYVPARYPIHRRRSRCWNIHCPYSRGSVTAWMSATHRATSGGYSPQGALSPAWSLAKTVAIPSAMAASHEGCRTVTSVHHPTSHLVMKLVKEGLTQAALGTLQDSTRLIGIGDPLDQSGAQGHSNLARLRGHVLVGPYPQRGVVG